MQNRARKGYTLTELIVAMVLAGILLPAIGFAVQSGLFNYSANTEISRARQSAQIVMDRITRQTRACYNCDMTDNGTSDQLEITMDSAGSEVMTYKIEQGDMICSVNGSDHVLLDSSAENLTINEFNVLVETETVDGTAYATLVQCTLDLSVGDYSFDISASAVPRVSH